MVFGTFDGLHAGHLNFFQQAKTQGDYLIIIVARNSNVKKIKGHLPKLDEKKRLVNVKAAGIGDKVILGEIKNPYAVIKKFKPEIICLGYDQNSFCQNLKSSFSKVKVTRLKSYKPTIYKSSKMNQELRIMNHGR